jgi:hypothetical protein
VLVAECREAALQLRHRTVNRGEVLCRAGRQGAIQLGERPGRRQLLGALDQRPLELATQVLLEAVDLIAIESGLLGAAPLSLEAQRSANALHVNADHARPLASTTERGDGKPREVAHLPVAALGDCLAHGLAQLVQVQAAAAVVPPILADAPFERLRLAGAEEEAIEEELEDAAVLL